MKLSRYNEIMFALLGTLLLLGAILCGVLIAYAAMEKSPEQGLAIAPPKDGTPAPKRVLTFCSAVTEPGGAFEYIPVSAVVVQNADKAAFISSGESYGRARYYYASLTDCRLDSSIGATRTFNVVVRDRKTSRQHLLLDKPGQIVTLHTPDPDQCPANGTHRRDDDGYHNRSSAAPCGKLLWEIRLRDSNGDGRLDDEDALVAYSSDLSASSLQALTPEDATLLSSQWLPDADEWQFTVRRDSNHDGRFGAEDGTELLETRGSAPQAAVSPIAPEVMDGLRRAIQ
ncbi:MAG: hypothetical protein ACREVL_00710 [Solimonas sp.]